MLDLDAIEARAEAATPGPWRNEPDTGAGRVWVQRGYFRDEADCEPLFSLRGKEAYEQRSADADFIARARTDIPALVAELRAARADITEMAYRGTALSGAVDRLEGIVATQAAELRAAREVVEAAEKLETDIESDLDWLHENLIAALAAYRAVVGGA